MKTRAKPKIGRRIILIAIIIVAFFLVKNHRIHLDEKITVQKGDSAAVIFNQINARDRMRLKLYVRSHDINFSRLEPGDYVFSGSYSRETLINQILQGPTKNYVRYTVLEGWSIYDIDEDLAQKGYIQAGEYMSFAQDATIIGKYAQRYPFINSQQKSLEGFLYPDTYHLDAGKDIKDQLVYLQLETFKNKVWTEYQSQLQNFTYNVYDTITLASILEKEERNSMNKATVAGIFLKRLDIGMKLDADITLCYGLRQSYKSCTPAVIARNIKDNTNPYNTREVGGLTPTPIANPTLESILAVLNYQPSDYLFYLHDGQGQIHYGRNIQEHNQNKLLYLR